MTSIVRHLARRTKKGIVSSKLLKPGEPTMPRPLARISHRGV